MTKKLTAQMLLATSDVPPPNPYPSLPPHLHIRRSYFQIRCWTLFFAKMWQCVLHNSTKLILCTEKTCSENRPVRIWYKLLKIENITFTQNHDIAVKRSVNSFVFTKIALLWKMDESSFRCQKTTPFHFQTKVHNLYGVHKCVEFTRV